MAFSPIMRREHDYKDWLAVTLSDGDKSLVKIKERL